MPTYDYRCKACGQELEVFQSFNDDPLTTCEACGGELRKLFGAPGIAFKGSGFYKNDSRGSKRAAASSTSETSSGDTGSSDKSSSDKSSSDKGSSDKGSSTSDSGSSPTKKEPASTSSSKGDAAS